MADRVALPLYARIEAQLREAIAGGEYAVGTLLPTEAELCETLRVSRHTIREALRRLVESGLVERRQGAGTMVVAREAPSGTVQSMRSIEALFQYAADTRLDIRSRRMAPLTPEDAAAVPAHAGEQWLTLEGLRIGQDGAPIATADVLIHPRFATIANALPERGAIYAMIESRFGVEVAEVVQEITAAPMPAAVAAALGRKPRAVGMRFLRRYLGTDGATLLLSRSWHPAERFTYAMRLRRGEG
ncbi:GntR family transcriptional regulator [Falsiroseomonas sp.]|uniref:GntR family transcriptional regulator n=1 Tax=Falsiroseomonas sp. TaxID=2870721 RepID=UPI003F70C2DB